MNWSDLVLLGTDQSAEPPVNGHTWVESEGGGKGNTFTFEVPLMAVLKRTPLLWKKLVDVYSETSTISS